MFCLGKFFETGNFNLKTQTPTQYFKNRLLIFNSQEIGSGLKWILKFHNLSFSKSSFTNWIQKSRNSSYLWPFASNFPIFFFLRRWEFVRSLGIELGLKIPTVGDGTIEGYQNDFWRSEESSEGSFDQIIQHLLTTSGYISNEINFQNSFLRSQKVKLLKDTPLIPKFH